MADLTSFDRPVAAGRIESRNARTPPPGSCQRPFHGGSGASGERKVDYRRLVNPFEPVRVYSDDRIAAIHDMALKVLEDLGMRLLLPAALDLLRAKGRDGVLDRR